MSAGYVVDASFGIELLVSSCLTCRGRETSEDHRLLKKLEVSLRANRVQVAVRLQV
jgi:hypothetical protein